MSSYPFYFKFKRDIPGRGYCVRVEVVGKVLACKEDDLWWLYGVQPGGIAEYGPEPGEGLNNFSNTFKEVLEDIAGEAKNTEEFEKKARFFFKDVCRETAEEWERSREAIKARREKCADEFAGIKLEKTELACTINFEILSARKTEKKKDKPKTKASDNVPHDDYRCAA